MLQQTRVDVVIPRYSEFLTRFPTIDALAAAEEEGVLAAWSGLGYYRRARNLHAAARMIVRDHSGTFPSDPAIAIELPGVGRYTAHAVASIAYDRPVAVVDGNVARVVSRLLTLSSPRASALQQAADLLLDPRKPGDANQALMELGATICSPTSPLCESCPVRLLCRAHRLGQVDRYPQKKPRKASARIESSLWIVRDRRGRIWLEKREQSPLRGLWMLPWRFDASEGARGQSLGSVNHAIMNRRYRCAVVATDGRPIDLPGEAAGRGRWVDPDQLDNLPHSSLVGKALRLAERNG